MSIWLNRLSDPFGMFSHELNDPFGIVLYVQSTYTCGKPNLRHEKEAGPFGLRALRCSAGLPPLSFLFVTKGAVCC